MAALAIGALKWSSISDSTLELRPGHRTPLPSAWPATIFVPFGLPRLSRVVAPQNAQGSLPDRSKARGLPCTRFYASVSRRSHMEQRLDPDIVRRRRQARLPSRFNLPPTATFARF